MVFTMNVSQENLKKAEQEAQEAWDELQLEMNKLFDTPKGRSSNGLGPVSEEERKLLKNFDVKITAIREKYGISHQ